jgi:hypothetical protein
MHALTVMHYVISYYQSPVSPLRDADRCNTSILMSVSCITDYFPYNTCHIHFYFMKSLFSFTYITMLAEFIPTQCARLCLLSFRVFCLELCAHFSLLNSLCLCLLSTPLFFGHYHIHYIHMHSVLLLMKSRFVTTIIL